MNQENKKPEIVFAPGCFDNFEGTQEELDELITEIQRMVDSGELFEKSTPVALDDLSDEDLEALADQLGLTEMDLEDDEYLEIESLKETRKLH